jgi:hypothetical protein
VYSLAEIESILSTSTIPTTHFESDFDFSLFPMQSRVQILPSFKGIALSLERTRQKSQENQLKQDPATVLFYGESSTTASLSWKNSPRFDHGM